MTKLASRFSRLALLLVAVSGCAVSPTGQRQLKLFPADEMAKMGTTAFEQTKKEMPGSTDKKVTAYIECVASAVLTGARVAGNWEVRVFESAQPNAFAVPGGKIGVYTGMLKVARNQNQLAAVIGHEIAHVTADHGNARVSAAYATDTGLKAAQVLAGAPSPGKQQLLGLLGLGAQYGVLLPYGRGQESEADVVGLELMAAAGFDPRAAPELWRNMSAQGGKQQPAFLSTHPSHQDRIERLNRAMANALDKYKQARRNGANPACE